MRHTLLLIVTAFLTFGWVGELFAQVPSASSTRQGALFAGGSRVALFTSGGEFNNERDVLKSKSLEQRDGKMDLLVATDPAKTLNKEGIPSINMFVTVSEPLQRLILGVDATATAPVTGGTGGLIISQDVQTDPDQEQAVAIIGRTGMYPPRLRYWVTPAELEAMEKPETVAQMASSDRKRATELVADINDKFDLPTLANITLEFDGLTAVIQGRVPNPTARKQVEMYLSFEPGVYSVKNNLVIDPSVLAATDSAIEAP